jgi:hypothetical protein
MNKDVRSMIRVPLEWKEQILDKLTYATFTIETEDSYKKGLEVKAIEDEESKTTGKIHYDCNHVSLGRSVSIKINIYNYEKLIQDKYDELFSKYGDRLSKSICLT